MQWNCNHHMFIFRLNRDIGLDGVALLLSCVYYTLSHLCMKTRLHYIPVLFVLKQ